MESDLRPIATMANQRFVRTANRELRVHGKCVDGHNGQVGDPVRLWDCNNAANLTPAT